MMLNRLEHDMNQLYTACFSGMIAASRGLQTSAYNLSNMQTSGFKRQELNFDALGGQPQNHQGVRILGERTNFSSGRFLNSENQSDLAIIGQGYFIIELKDGSRVYTKNGQFTLNEDQYLIDGTTNGHVLGFNEQGRLAPIRAKGPKQCNGKATSFVALKGHIYFSEYKKEPTDQTPIDPTQGKYEDISFSIPDIFDASGKAHKINLKLKNDFSEQSGLKWNIDDISGNDNDNISFAPQSIEFTDDRDGRVKTDHNTIVFKLNGNQKVTFNLNDYLNDADASVSFQKKTVDNSQLDIVKQDGYGTGKQINWMLNEKGQMIFIYDNNQEVNGNLLALARFDNEERTLKPNAHNQFYAISDEGQTIGGASVKGFGTLKSKQIESSNVDSTIEFGHIVVLQRMFQACSQLMDIEKQLIDALEKKS